MTNNADAWNLPKVVDYFSTRRKETKDVYPSEWFFLKDRLYEGMSILDIGCAQGGFSNILSENIIDFSYTGLDISGEMIKLARAKFPKHTFHHIPENDYTILQENQFDLVLVLGILHLHESWKETLKAAWEHSKKTLIFDLRESHLPTIEDKSKSFFKMDINGGNDTYKSTTLPYNIINSSDALQIINDICTGANKLAHYGYLHTPADSAQCPMGKVLINTYCSEK
jgi:SAM-dependent methyltransferase